MKQKYSIEQKYEVCEAILNTHKTIQDYEIPSKTIERWLGMYERDATCFLREAGIIGINQEAWDEMKNAYLNHKETYYGWLINELCALYLQLSDNEISGIQMDGKWRIIKLNEYQDFILHYFDEIVYQDILNNVDIV